MFYVYLLQNEKGNLYIGFTRDLRRRLNQHNQPSNKGFTKNHNWQLIYYESYKSKRNAQSRERRLKYYGNAIRQLKNRLEASLNGDS